MKKLLATAALLATTVLSPTLANAEAFNFSYEFWNQGALAHTVTGSFDGVRNGNLVTGLSNVSVKRDGVAFDGNGSLQVSYVGNLLNTSAQASFDGKANDFIFTGYKNGEWSNIFYSNSKPLVGKTGYKYIRDHAGLPASQITVPTHWVLTPVPEPETYAMLLAGLGVMGAVARRRKSKQV